MFYKGRNKRPLLHVRVSAPCSCRSNSVAIVARIHLLMRRFDVVCDVSVKTVSCPGLGVLLVQTYNPTSLRPRKLRGVFTIATVVLRVMPRIYDNIGVRLLEDLYMHIFGVRY